MISTPHRFGLLAAGLMLLAPVASARSTPFDGVDVTLLPAAISRNSYDLQPAVLHDPANAARPWQMWWLGDYTGGADLPPYDLPVGDRIYYAWSTDGTNWSTPQVVLKAQGGLTSYDAADDHLVGSPSVVKVNGTYYMYYEAYGKWMTNVVRLWNGSDSWIHNGTPQNSTGWTPSYSLERVLGIAPRFRKPGTHPVYAGQVTYSNGHVNRFLSCSPITNGGGGYTWQALDDNEPVFWLYDDPGPGRKALYMGWDGAQNSFVTDDSGYENLYPDPTYGCTPGSTLLGYAIADVDRPDMTHANQNRICLATSTNGVDWTRFIGAAPGKAVLAPSNAFTNTVVHNCGGVNPQELYDLHRAYGSGYPIALIRDNYLELYFTDDTEVSMSACTRLPLGHRIRIPVSQIGNKNAYVNAARVATGGGIPGDIKWSPMHDRYFAQSIQVVAGSDPCAGNFQQSPAIFWSEAGLPAGAMPTFAAGDHLDTLPTGGSIGIWGGIVGDPLGQTIDYVSGGGPVSALHMFYEATPPGVCASPHERDIHHLLAFVYAPDSDNDDTPDALDGCPNDPDKTEPGICGCGMPDADSDTDGVLNCNDGCPNDSNKVDPGTCGCGTPDSDGDGDGDLDCVDNCPDIANANQADCDGDGVGDACAIASGASADCNGNGIPDACDIASGSSDDFTANQVPDECEGCIGDVSGDGHVGFADLNLMLSDWGTCSQTCASDLNNDGQVGFTDLNYLLSSWGPCPGS